ncbi:MAG: hypothetical protein LBI53_05515 [Candidatus Peribacteria bacterium]|nr:hypothetical protein [Candidatus Peribacteria bacterium]
MIQDGEINPEIYQNISHWNKPYSRTILVIAEHKQPFLYVSLDKITLPTAATRISNMTEH